jgi:hypothetical protein
MPGSRAMQDDEFSVPVEITSRRCDVEFADIVFLGLLLFPNNKNDNKIHICQPKDGEFLSRLVEFVIEFASEDPMAFIINRDKMRLLNRNSRTTALNGRGWCVVRIEIRE